ncbi:MAG: hypothetical protein AAF950_07205 [Pseudomonadota bacterium]
MPRPKTKDPRTKAVGVALSKSDAEFLGAAAKKNGRKLSAEMYARIKFTMDIIGDDDVFEAGSALLAAKRRIKLTTDVRKAAETMGQVPILIQPGQTKLRTAFGHKTIGKREGGRRSVREAVERGVAIAGLDGSPPDDFRIYAPGDQKAYDLRKQIRALKMETDLVFTDELRGDLERAPKVSWDAISDLIVAFDNQQPSPAQFQEMHPDMRERHKARRETAIVNITDILQASLEYQMAREWTDCIDEEVVNSKANPEEELTAEKVEALAKQAAERIMGSYIVFKRNMTNVESWCRHKLSA